MIRRLWAVLVSILQPLEPASRLSASLQIVVTVGGTGVLAFLPFGLASDWTWRKAAVVALAAFAMLSSRAAYRSKADKDALLSDTSLGELIAARLSAGGELQRRVKMSGGEEIRRNLAEEVIGWGGATITQVHDRAPDLGDRLNADMGHLPDTRVRKDYVRYMRHALAVLRKLARDLRGSD